MDRVNHLGELRLDESVSGCLTVSLETADLTTLFISLQTLVTLSVIRMLDKLASRHSLH